MALEEDYDFLKVYSGYSHGPCSYGLCSYGLRQGVLRL